MNAMKTFFVLLFATCISFATVFAQQANRPATGANQTSQNRTNQQERSDFSFFGKKNATSAAVGAIIDSAQKVLGNTPNEEQYRSALDSIEKMTALFDADPVVKLFYYTEKSSLLQGLMWQYMPDKKDSAQILARDVITLLEQYLAFFPESSWTKAPPSASSANAVDEPYVNAGVFSQLTLIYSEIFKDYEKALYYLDYSIALFPKREDLYMAKYTIYRDTGKMKEACETLKKAKELGATVPDALFDFLECEKYLK